MICVVCSFLIKKYWIWYSFEKVFSGKFSCINFSLIELSLGIFIGKISKESAGKNQSHIYGRITAVKVDIICMYM